MLPRRPSDLFTVAELACYLGVSRWTIARIVRQGDLRPVTVGKRLRFRPVDVDAYLARASCGASETDVVRCVPADTGSP